MIGSQDFRLWCAAVAAAVTGLPAPAADPDPLAPLATGQWVFVGKVTAAKAGPVAQSNPPIHSFTLSFEPAESLRGKAPKDVAAFRYQVRQQNAPTFPADQTYLVAVKAQEKNWVVAYLGPADKDAVAKAKALLALPVGWAVEGGKPVSPWAGLRVRAWPEGAAKPKGPECSKCGRPALLVGDAVEFTVEQVPAENPQKFKNDMYGDGKFKVTLRNTSDKDVEVPALLTDGKTVFWADSLFVMVRDRPHLLIGAGRAKAAQPVKLKAGESLVGTIDALLADGVEWPRGGQRVYFDFVLGEKSANNFFYYFSQLHDPMREAAQKKAFEN
jgi:hypothetical protein